MMYYINRRVESPAGLAVAAAGSGGSGGAR
jgi:hypothetical protein